MPAAPDTERKGTRLVVGVALGLVLVLGVFVRWEPIDYNLPVASHVDERASLATLRRLDRIGMNPGTFHYPTFYFYVCHFALGAFDEPARVLRHGRMLNLVVACGLALATYALARRVSASRAAGVIAAALAMFSPVFVETGAYIITDVMLALLVTAALVAFDGFVRRGSLRAWLAAVVLSGLALSTKYSALILIPFYLALEYAFADRLRERIGPAGERAGVAARLVRKELRPRTLGIATGALAIVLVAAGAFFPERYLLGLVEQMQRVDSVVDEEDRAFLASVGRALLALGFASALFAALCFRAPSVARRFTSVRPWLGTALLVGTFVLGSPFVLVSWKAFLFEFGYELKANQGAGDTGFWLQYGPMVFDVDSAVALVFAGVGACYVVARYRRGLPVLLFLAIGYASVGSATRGAERYLAPLLPSVYALAALGMVAVADALSGAGRRRVASVAFLSLVVVGGAVDLWPKVEARLAARSGVDEMHASFTFVAARDDVGRILYAGYVPDVELQERGFTVVRAPLGWLASESPRSRMGPQDLLLVDRAAYEVFGPVARAQLELLWSTDEGYGQYAFRRAKGAR